MASGFSRQTTLLAIPGFTKQVNVVDRAKGRKKIENVVDETEVDNVEVQDVGLEEARRRKRARTLWNEKWKTEFEWVEFDRVDARMFCSICKEDKNSKSEFGSLGAINIQHSALVNHCTSKNHKLLAWASHSGKKTLNLGVSKQFDVVEDSMKNLFRVSYFVAKNDLAYAKYVPTLELLRVCNAPSIPSNMYNNDKSCASFVHYIGKALELEYLTHVRQSPFFGILIDESIDISIEEHMIVYVSYIKDSEPKMSFLDLLEVTDRTSRGLFVSLRKLLIDFGLDEQKLVSFGSDGASVMVGKNGGVAKRLKNICPFLTSMHCMAHRTNLCASSTIGEFPYAKYVDSTLNELATFFRTSVVRLEKLKALQQEFDLPFLKMEGIHAIRWLSRHKVLCKFCELIEPLLEFFKVENANIFSKISSFTFVYVVHFLGDLFSHLTSLSKIFQCAYVDVTTIPGIVEAEIGAMEMEFLMRPDLDLNALELDGHEYPIIPDYGPSKGLLYELRASMRGPRFRSIELTRDQNGLDLDLALNFQKAFTTHMIESMRERFDDNSIIGHFKILSPSCYPPSKDFRKDLKNFGAQELEKLEKFYGEAKKLKGGELIANLVDPIRLRKDFQTFKFQAFNEWRGWNFKNTWGYIGSNETLREKYGMLLVLAQIALVQCCSTAICERGFSVQNVIKNKLRNSLTTKSMRTLMRISLEGPPLDEFNFDEATALWRNDAKTSRHAYTSMDD
ncbi:hypothetical protein L7F22_000047 [Adiantum nelumboides]|nr:hypothetical protein [Adiantum nelumboides]